MADDLDALFELFEHDEAEKYSEPNTSKDGIAGARAEAAPTPKAGQLEEDDMLLSLADEITSPQQANTHLNQPYNMQSPNRIAQRSSHQTARPAALPTKSKSSIREESSIPAPAVQMSKSGAFAAINKPNKPSSIAGISKPLPPAATGTTLVPSDSIGNSVSVGPGITKPGQQQQQRRSGECLHYVEKLTNLKIRNPRVSGIVLRERYKQLTYVPIAKARDHDPGSAGWVVIGVLVTKIISTTSQGSPYSRWRLADLAGSDVWISLFGDAHKDNYAEAEGSILAFYNPKFSSKGPGGSRNSSSNGLAVSQSHQVELLATSSGWGFCKGKTKTGARCQNAVDTTVSCYCQYHALQQAKTLKKPAAAATGDNAPPLIAAASNGKVFDAKSNSWSSSATTAAAVASGSSLTKPGGSSSSRLGSSVGNGSTTIRKLSSSSNDSHGIEQQQQLRAVVATGAANGAAAAAAAASSRQQDDLREKLRQMMQQRQQNSGQPAATAAGTAASAPQRAAAAVPCNRNGGFKLGTVLAAVSSGGNQQQQQQQEEHELSADDRGGDCDEQWLLEQQENIDPTAAAAAVDDDEHHASKRPCIDVSNQQAPTMATTAEPLATTTTTTAATATAGVSGISKPVRPRHIQMPPPPAAAAAAAGSGALGVPHSSSSSSKYSVGQKPASVANKKLRADLGLGPKPGSSGSSTKAVSGSSSSKPPHMSRIGLVGAAAQQKGLGSGSGLGSRTAGGSSGGSSNSGFKAAFSRVLQRDDVSQPRSELLAAAADQKHAAMMSKLLDHFEQKDQLAQQLEGITKLQVTAFECRTCKILTEKRRVTCSGHDVVAVRVTKRWWTCDACGWKIHTLRELMPTKRCPKCRDPGVMFTAASAYNAPKPQLSGSATSAIASRDALLPRGVEHAFCLQNSL